MARENSYSRFTELSTLNTYVLAETPGVPVVFLTQTVVSVLKDFCERTHAWRYVLDRFSVIEDQSEYAIDDWPEDGELWMLERITEYNVDSDKTDYVGQNLDTNYLQLDPERGIMTLIKTPRYDAVNALEVEVSLRPARTCTRVHTRFFNDYCEVLAKGVKSELMKMIGKKWSNPQRGAQLESEYRRERGNVIEDVKSGRFDRINRPNGGLLA